MAFLAVLLRLWVTSGELLLAAIGYAVDYKRQGKTNDVAEFSASVKTRVLI